jgi:hypothetical protein
MQDSTKHDGPWSSWQWLATFLPQEKIEKEIKHKGISVTLTSEACQTFLQVDKGM